MRLIVTRVQPQAQHWADCFAASGHEVLVLPLIEVRGLPDATAVHAAWQQLPGYAAAMFVSRHAVDFFFHDRPGQESVSSPLAAPAPRFWSTGPGTAKALLEHGVAPALLDTPAKEAGQFDSEALWKLVHARVRPGDKVLIVRGDSVAPDGSTTADNDAGVGREWLAARLREAGAQVDFVVAYQRGAPVWGAGQRQLARDAASDGSVWLFSSAEALGHLQGLLPGQDWSATRAHATHSRIAAAARDLGFGVVTQSRPTWEDVLASIESSA